jgi:hypothetical protein
MLRMTLHGTPAPGFEHFPTPAVAMMRIATATIVGVLGCASMPSFSRTDPCAAMTAGTAQPFDSSLARGLAGTYRLTLVSDWEDEKGRQVRGRLTLQPTDTLHERYERILMRRPVPTTDRRPLWGWAQLKPKNVTVPLTADPASRDPDHPGVLLHANGTLELGVWRGLDGSSVALHLQSVSTNGFGGTWSSDLGIVGIWRDDRLLPNPHGHFCAFRE